MSIVWGKPDSAARQSGASLAPSERGATPASPSNIPPPPVEVVIRTMESDIRSLSQTGGGSGRVVGETLKLHDLAAKEASPKSALRPILIIVGFLILATAVYFSFFYR